MSTNRTKIDWAYKQAEHIFRLVTFSEPNDVQDYHTLRQIAAYLRRAEKRGRQVERNAQTLRWSLPKVETPCSHGLTDSMQCGECALDRR